MPEFSRFFGIIIRMFARRRSAITRLISMPIIRNMSRYSLFHRLRLLLVRCHNDSNGWLKRRQSYIRTSCLPTGISLIRADDLHGSHLCSRLCL
jgi:hypothetical protein